MLGPAVPADTQLDIPTNWAGILCHLRALAFTIPCVRHVLTTASSRQGSGRVSGILASDVVSIAGLTVSSQTFGAVQSESSEFAEEPNDGLIGMAFGTIAQSRAPTFFENLLQQRAVSAPLFGVHLERGHAQGSAVCLGCFDSGMMTGPLVWVPVKSRVRPSFLQSSSPRSRASTDLLVCQPRRDPRE
jgi:hypothetical protein